MAWRPDRFARLGLSWSVPSYQLVRDAEETQREKYQDDDNGDVFFGEAGAGYAADLGLVTARISAFGSMRRLDHLGTNVTFRIDQGFGVGSDIGAEFSRLAVRLGVDAIVYPGATDAPLVVRPEMVGTFGLGGKSGDNEPRLRWNEDPQQMPLIPAILTGFGYSLHGEDTPSFAFELSDVTGLSVRSSVAGMQYQNHLESRYDDWPEVGSDTRVDRASTFGRFELSTGRYRTVNRSVMLRRGYTLGYRSLRYVVDSDGSNREDVYTGQFLFGPDGEIHILPFRGRFSLFAAIALLNSIDSRLNRVINDKRFPPGIGEKFLDFRAEPADLQVTVGMRWQPVVPLYLLGENSGERLAGVVPGLGSSAASDTTVIGTGWRDLFSLRMSLGGEVSAGGITMGDGSETWLIYSSLIVDIVNNHSLRFNSGGGDAGRVDTSVPADLFGTELSPKLHLTIARFFGLEYAYGVPILESLSASAGLRAQILEHDFPGYENFDDRSSNEELPLWDKGGDLFVITRYYTAGPSVRLAWHPGRFWMELGAGYQHVLATRRAYAKYVDDGRDRIRFEDPDGFFLLSLGVGLRL